MGSSSKCAQKSTSLCFQILPEILLIVALFAYAVIGALVFRALEEEQPINTTTVQKKPSPTTKGYAFSKLFCDSIDFHPIPNNDDGSKYLLENLTTPAPNPNALWIDQLFPAADLDLPVNASDLALCYEKIAWGYSHVTAKQLAAKGLTPSCDDKLEKWDLLHAAIFAGTLFTTIGYGEVAPKTDEGRAFTIFFSLFGIPLFLVLLSRLGKLFAKAFVNMWIRFRAIVCNYQLQIEEEVMAAAVERMDFPLPIAVAIACGWLFVCAIVFAFWEKWSYFTAIYFTFITLTTIGLGDVTPTNPNAMLLGCVMVIIGLSLISMVLDLMQKKIEQTYFDIVNKIQVSTLDELDLDEDPEVAVEEILRGKTSRVEGSFWGMAAGEERKRRLREEWERRRNQRVKTIQTIDPSEWTTDSCVQCEILPEPEPEPDTEQTDGDKSNFTRIIIPLKETPSRRSGSVASSRQRSMTTATAGLSTTSIISSTDNSEKLDDVKVMIRSIEDILGDCQNILHPERVQNGHVFNS